MITSIQNPRIKIIRDLLGSKKERDALRLMVLEGVRLAEEALKSGLGITQCIFSTNLSSRGNSVLEQIRQTKAQIEEVTPELMDRVSDTQHAQGILLVCALPEIPLPHAPSYLLVLDRISDPGNLGTILRAAAALGVQGVLLTPGTSDPFAPKALRAAMGAQLHLPIKWQDVEAIKETCAAAEKRLMLTASLMDCPQDCWDMDLTQPICLVIGNEANGISPQLIALSDQCVRIPIADETESFNAAVAAAILMYEIKRQRKMK